MPYSTTTTGVDGEGGDWEKLRQAYREIVTKFGSFEDVLVAFGLSNLPTAQRYGILFGCVVFVTTVLAVCALLFFGGTFRRIAEEETNNRNGASSVESDYRVRLDRPLLLERLLAARQRMLRENYPNLGDGVATTNTSGGEKTKTTSTKITNLTRMLSSLPPPRDDDDGGGGGGGGNQKNNNENNHSGIIDFNLQRAEIMVGYKQNFILGYRKCQDKPGGEV
jgi:hypothetical protein